VAGCCTKSLCVSSTVTHLVGRGCFLVIGRLPSTYAVRTIRGVIAVLQHVVCSKNVMASFHVQLFDFWI